jgi:hypothetical protein
MVGRSTTLGHFATNIQSPAATGPQRRHGSKKSVFQICEQAFIAFSQETGEQDFDRRQADCRL